MVEREGDTAEQGAEVATVDCDIGLFDNIDDFLEFPAGDILDVGAGGWEEGCNFLCSDPLMLAVSDAGDGDFPAAAGLSVPMEEIADVKWLSNFIDDDSNSLCADNIFLFDETPENRNKGKNPQFMTLSPNSILESTSSTSSSKDIAISLPFQLDSATRRARTKRSRAPREHIISPTTSSFGETDHDDSMCVNPLVESLDLFDLDYYVKLQSKKVAKGKKKKQEDVDWDCCEVGYVAEMSLRKCAHCGIQKTPQWRAGPNGPKTLCNACGVRYKSGRLFPEYRPAASPTFVPSIHSNSHKKVLEMRHKMGPKGPAPIPFFVRKSMACNADDSLKTAL